MLNNATTLLINFSCVGNAKDVNHTKFCTALIVFSKEKLKDYFYSIKECKETDTTK